MISVSVTERPLFERLQLFKNPKLMRRFANNVRGYSRSNITRQRSPEGQPWAPRKKGEGQMYLGMRKLLYVRDVTTHSATITLAKGNYSIHAAQLAYAMHHAQGITAPPAASENTHWGKLSESERQEWRALSSAERLHRWGYKRRTKNGYVRASLQYLEGMSGNQQGLLIRKFGLSESAYLRARARRLRSIMERMEKRPFMGANQQQRQQALKRAWQSTVHEMSKKR